MDCMSPFPRLRLAGIGRLAFPSVWPLKWLRMPALAVATVASTVTAQELPPAIEADRLRLVADQQVLDNDLIGALATLDQIIALLKGNSLDIPADLWFRDAEVALAARLPDRARESASRYLKSAGRNGEHYQAALELLVQAETRLAEVERLRPGLVFRDCRMCPLLVVVPDGRFVMGSPESEGRRWPDEGPQHWVWIGSPFAVGVYEVTFSEWDECVAVGGCNRWVPGDEGWGRGSRPVINVSWEDAQAYVEWLSRQTGEQYRLLSEAEWEWVARAGTSTSRFWWSSVLDAEMVGIPTRRVGPLIGPDLDLSVDQCRYANGRDETVARSRRLSLGQPHAKCSDGHANTAPAGSFEANPWGLFDVLGNVWEWTEDCWNDSYNGAPAFGNAWLAGDCSKRVLRGGSMVEGPDDLRVAFRHGSSATRRDYRFGFRVARVVR